MTHSDLLSFIAEDIELAKRTMNAAAESNELAAVQYRLGVRQLERALERLAEFADERLPMLVNTVAATNTPPVFEKRSPQGVRVASASVC